MGRRTVQMALMRTGVPSSVTPQVGAVLQSPVQLGCPVPGLLAASWWGWWGEALGRSECVLGSGACDVAYWFLLSLVLGWRCCQKGIGLAPLLVVT